MKNDYLLIIEKMEDLQKYYDKETDTYILGNHNGTDYDEIKILFPLNTSSNLDVSGIRELSVKEITVNNLKASDIFAESICCNELEFYEGEIKKLKCNNLSVHTITANLIEANNIKITNYPQIEELNCKSLHTQYLVHIEQIPEWKVKEYSSDLSYTLYEEYQMDM